MRKEGREGGREENNEYIQVVRSFFPFFSLPPSLPPSLLPSFPPSLLPYLLIHIEGSAAHVPRLQGSKQVHLIHDATTRAINNVHALLHLREAFRVDEVLGVGRQGRVEGDEVSLGPDLVQVALLDAQLLERKGGREEWSEDEEVSPVPQKASR